MILTYAGKILTYAGRVFNYITTPAIPPPPYAVFSKNSTNILTDITGLNYQIGGGPSPDSDPFSLLALGLLPGAGIINITPDLNFNSNFEIFNPNTASYTSSAFTINYSGGSKNLSGFKIRLKNGLPSSFYSASITITAPNTSTFVLTASGNAKINPFITNAVLAFNLDQASGTLVTDSSVRGNNGQLGGTISPVWDSAGIINQCLNFQGDIGGASSISSYITIPTSSDWTFGTGDFTMLCWVVPQNTSGFWCPFDLGYQHNAGVLLEFDTSSQVFRIYLNGPNVKTTSNTMITPGNRYMLTLRRMSGQLEFFVNTTKLLSVSDSSDILNSGHPILLGSFAGGGESLNGKGDIFYIYNGRGITDSELTTLYNSGNGMQPL